MGLLGSEDVGLGSVLTAAGDKPGGGVGTITEIESTDGSITVTNPAGPVVDLTGAGTVKRIESPDGSIAVTDPTGPTIQIETADKTPSVIATFTGTVVTSEGATLGYLANPGQNASSTEGPELSPQLYPTAARTFDTMRVTATGGGFLVDCTVTLYRNGAPTLQTVTIPAGAGVGSVFVDSGNPIAFAANDKFDVRWDINGGGAFLPIAVTLEGPGPGAGGGIAGYSWLSTQLGRAAAMAPGLDSPWFDDFIINPGFNLGGQGIAWSNFSTGTGTATPAAKPGGVYLLDTGGTAQGIGELGTPNSGPFILQNPVSGPFYVSSRCLVPLPGVGDDQAEHRMIQLRDGTNQEVMAFEVGYSSGVAIYTFFMVTVAGGAVNLVSTAPVDFGNAHDFAIGFDGTTIAAYIDGVIVSGLSTTNLAGVSANDMRFSSLVKNNAFAGSVTMYLDKLCAIQRSMQ